MRIVAGKWKGRNLVKPTDLTIRPTTDRVRESLFNIINNHYPDLLYNSRILDLFAGTGALGLESLSRGAKYAVFVENSVQGRGLIRQNIENLLAQGCSRLLKRDATDLGDIGKILPFNLIFADPPYRMNLGERALENAFKNGWLAKDSVCILEEDKNVNISLSEFFTIEDKRIYGKSCLYFLKVTN
ncbi:16S rRNA (guanine(966)-N(2))-methyltransferase RsmD [Bartonella sp. DGB1]|uniref:16S rRNA (guanine(966)-N(2))-methyltransferase RsmD n=1 Tax=Bartonella sp. DGB1 TaxID=3239807 RepID=UPI0035255D88